MEACGKRVAFSKARWARSVRPRRRQRPQGPGSVPRATHPASTLRQWLWQNNPPVSEANSGMQLKTILNRIQKHRGFVYGPIRLREGAALRLEVEIYPHLRNRPRCSGCGRRGPQYDTLPVRWFEFVPLWGLRVFFLYRMRRVACAPCGRVRVERVPWAEGKHQLTTTYAWFLARWAKRLSWREVAATFRTTWDSVFRAVAMAVAWGRAHQDLTGIDAVGIDEIQWQHGHRYLTLVYQIDPGHTRLLWIGQARRVKTLLRFFRWFGRERTQAVRFICSDMWQPYLKVVAKKAAEVDPILWTGVRHS